MTDTKADVKDSKPFFPAGSAGAKVVSLLLWEDVVNSSIAVLCGVLFCSLLLFGGYTAVSLTAYLVLLQLVVCFAYVNGMRLWIKYTKSQQQSTATTEEDTTGESDYVSGETMRAALVSLAATINPLVALTVAIFRCRSSALTGAAIGVVFLIAIIGNCVDGVTVLLVAWLLAFSLPKAYYANQQVADKYIDKVLEQVRQVVAKLPISGKTKAA